MKALILSDSHGSTEELVQLKNLYRNSVDVMIHCGDSELSAHQDEVKEFEIVRGNCDYFETGFPEERTFTTKGVPFFVAHGHMHGIKSSLTTIVNRAITTGAKVVCFGHSHIRGAEMIDGILCINPGSILLPRVNPEKTYVLLEYTDEKIIIQFLDLNQNLIEEVVF